MYINQPIDYTFSSSVLYDGLNYNSELGDAVNICSGYNNLNEVISAIIKALNTISPGIPVSEQCKVKINANDICGYLFDKLESSDNSIEISTTGNSTIGYKIDLKVSPPENVIIEQPLKFFDTQILTRNNDNTPFYNIDVIGTNWQDGEMIIIEGVCKIIQLSNAQALQLHLKFSEELIGIICTQTNVPNNVGKTGIITQKDDTFKYTFKIKKINNTTVTAILHVTQLQINDGMTTYNMTTVTVPDLSVTSPNIKLYLTGLNYIVENHYFIVEKIKI